jgi:HEAT repeat protein
VPARAELTVEDKARAIAAVSALGARSLADRRAAARKLAAEQRDKPLPPVALEELSALVEAETDGPIWIDVMTVIARSDSAAAARIASAAASHTNAEVRRRACAWFGAHPSDRGADVLVNSLDDRDASVVLAAAQAIGLQPRLPDTDRLMRVSASDDHTLRVAAAESLARLHVSAGIEALSRLTHDRDAKVRRLAATAIGNAYSAAAITIDVGEMRFASAPASKGSPSLFGSHRAQLVDDLVRLLDDRAEVRRAAVIALAKVTGESPPKTAATAPSRAWGALPDDIHDTAAAAAWWKSRYETGKSRDSIRSVLE